MLTIFGIMMLAFWVLNGVSHPAAGSLMHLLSILSCISFVAEFVRSRAAAFLEGRREDEHTETAPTTPAGYAAPPITTRNFAEGDAIVTG